MKVTLEIPDEQLERLALRIVDLLDGRRPASSSAPAAGLEELCTVKQVAEVIPGVTEWTVREWIRRRDENGLEAAGAVRRVGSRWYIHKGRLLAWLDDVPERGTA